MKAGMSIGIDLGTTYCCVAVLRHHSQKPEIIPNDQGKNTTPSFVAFDEENEAYAGETAKDLAFEYPESTVFDIKRLLGRSFYDPHIQKYMKLWPFQLVNIEGLVGVVVGEKRILPQTITKELIDHLRQSAEAYLGCPIETAVITVPAYFSDLQLGLTREACFNAGLKSVNFIHEPTAAAYAYGLQSSVEPNKTKICLIFDLGGGTFDVTLFRLKSNKRLEVVATGGDARLGGEDFNDLLTEYCIQEFQKQHGINLADGKHSDNPSIRTKTARVLRRIRNECEKKKCFLSTTKNVVISLDGIHQDKVFAVTMNRSIFDGIIHNHLTRCITTIDEILKKGGIDKNAVDDVVLIGGSSRIPKVQEMVSEYFGGKILRKTIHVDEAVACGAAVYAYNKFNMDSTDTDDLVTVVNSTEALQSYASIHNANIPGVQSAQVSKATIDPTIEKEMNDLKNIRNVIKKYRTDFSAKAVELFSWLQNLDLLENEVKKPTSASTLAFEMLLSALLDTPLLLELSRILFEKYENKDGLVLAEKVLERRSLAFGPDHLKTLEAQYEVALCVDGVNADSDCLQSATDALKLFEDVYDKRSKILGPDHVDTLQVEFEIAWILENHKKYQEALVKAKAILEKRRRVFDENHTAIIGTQVLIAKCHYLLNETSVAMKIVNDLYNNKLHLLTSYSILEQSIISNIFVLLYDRKEYKKALRSSEIWSDMLNSTLGPEHPKTLERLHEKALCLLDSDEYERGVETLRTVLEKRRKILGEENEDTLETKSCLESALNEEEKYKKAKSFFSMFGIK